MATVPDTADMAGVDPHLAVLRTELDRRERAYYDVGPVHGLTGHALWLRCARNAAHARLLARTWDRVSERHTAVFGPGGLSGRASSYATFYHVAERERWRSLARSVAYGIAVGKPDHI